MKNKYIRTIKNKHGESIEVDVYDVLEAFNVSCSALAHLAKKALCTGIRGHKSMAQDIQDIIDSAIRAKEINKHRGNVELSDALHEKYEAQKQGNLINPNLSQISD